MSKKSRDSREALLRSRGDHIRVICRFRPLIGNELNECNVNIHSGVKTEKGFLKVTHPDTNHYPEPKYFNFDDYFDENVAQIEVFEAVALPLIEDIFEGYNATIFAYGQTGSGKTYSMTGNLNKSKILNISDPGIGIIPRIIKEIWSKITMSSNDNIEFELKVSYLEIYNENIYDLLAETRNKKGQKLIIREYEDEVYVESLIYILKNINIYIISIIILMFLY